MKRCLQKQLPIFVSLALFLLASCSTPATAMPTINPSEITPVPEDWWLEFTYVGYPANPSLSLKININVPFVATASETTHVEATIYALDLKMDRPDFGVNCYQIMNTQGPVGVSIEYSKNSSGIGPSRYMFVKGQLLADPMDFQRVDTLYCNETPAGIKTVALKDGGLLGEYMAEEIKFSIELLIYCSLSPTSHNIHNGEDDRYKSECTLHEGPISKTTQTP